MDIAHFTDLELVVLQHELRKLPADAVELREVLNECDQMDYLINALRGKEGYVALVVVLLMAVIGAWLGRKQEKQ